MDWQDNGIIIKTSPHGEGKAVVTVFTEHHGRHLGYIRGTRKLNAILQPGCLVHCKWQARLRDQLGSWTLEAQQSFYSRLMQSPLQLTALLAACAWIELTLAEREDHGILYATFRECLEQLEREDGLARYVHFELSLLRDLGFGLDLAKCTVTGEKEGLIYVSPRTGRAVCAHAGEPYKEKLLPLPRFLVENCQETPIKDIISGLELSGHFLERFVLTQLNKAIPPARQRLFELLKRNAHGQSTRPLSRRAVG